MSTLEPTQPPPSQNVPRRTLGRTGVSVPILGFGTAPCGIRRGIAQGVEIYNAAIDAGVNYLDTAPPETGYGRAQAQLGHVLKDRRKDVFLVTKCHTADADTARRMLDKNLKELQTDQADLVYVHSLGDLSPTQVMGKNGILRGLVKARDEGKLRFIGLSGHSRPARFTRVLNSEWADEITVCMNSVNFADRHTYNFEKRVWTLAAKKKTALVAMKVFGGMIYSDKGMSNSMMPTEHHDQAFRYALSLPNVSLAVIGMATMEELRQNIARARRFSPMSQSEMNHLYTPGKQLARKWGAHYGPV
ncbi:MAG: aldo/keto reductase [Armatimonadaceae bacterium]